MLSSPPPSIIDHYIIAVLNRMRPTICRVENAIQFQWVQGDLKMYSRCVACTQLLAVS